MNEKPILFNPEMVRALPDGGKTQTRRVIKSSVKGCTVGAYTEVEKPTQPVNVQEDGEPWTDIKCPYGKIGDQLWVRETWRTVKSLDHFKPIDLPSAYSMIEGQRLEPPIEYLATPHNVYEGKTRPSIFMPRWASRINLEITNIRVERLQNISEEDAENEGIDFLRHVPDADETLTPKELFMCLWDSINGKPRADGVDISWGANPWVWVPEFRIIK